PARALGRDEDAGVDRARAGDAPAPPPDGRAFRGAGRDHPLQAEQRPARALAAAQMDGGVRHPQRLRIRLPLEPHRGDVAPARSIELSLFPYAVILQVTPIVAIAPLIIIYIDNLTVALLVCAWIVAFFPILSNTTIGLNSADHNLLDLMRLYGASRWQVLRY